LLATYAPKVGQATKPHHVHKKSLIFLIAVEETANFFIDFFILSLIFRPLPASLGFGLKSLFFAVKNCKFL